MTYQPLQSEDATLKPVGGDVGSSGGTAESLAEAVSPWRALTDDDRDAVFHSLPNMLDGFMKLWGWLDFAKHVEAMVCAKNADVAKDAARYRWLRSINHDGIAAYEIGEDKPIQHSILIGGHLDEAIDKAMRAPREKGCAALSA